MHAKTSEVRPSRPAPSGPARGKRPVPHPAQAPGSAPAKPSGPKGRPGGGRRGRPGRSTYESADAAPPSSLEDMDAAAAEAVLFGGMATPGGLDGLETAEGSVLPLRLELRQPASADGSRGGRGEGTKLRRAQLQRGLLRRAAARLQTDLSEAKMAQLSARSTVAALTRAHHGEIRKLRVAARAALDNRDREIERTRGARDEAQRAAKSNADDRQALAGALAAALASRRSMAESAAAEATRAGAAERVAALRLVTVRSRENETLRRTVAEQQWLLERMGHGSAPVAGPTLAERAVGRLLRRISAADGGGYGAPGALEEAADNAGDDAAGNDQVTLLSLKLTELLARNSELRESLDTKTDECDSLRSLCDSIAARTEQSRTTAAAAAVAKAEADTGRLPYIASAAGAAAAYLASLGGRSVDGPGSEDRVRFGGNIPGATATTHVSSLSVAPAGPEAMAQELGAMRQRVAHLERTLSACEYERSAAIQALSELPETRQADGGSRPPSGPPLGSGFDLDQRSSGGGPDDVDALRSVLSELLVLPDSSDASIVETITRLLEGPGEAGEALFDAVDVTAAVLDARNDVDADGTWGDASDRPSGGDDAIGIEDFLMPDEVAAREAEAEAEAAAANPPSPVSPTKSKTAKIPAWKQAALDSVRKTPKGKKAPALHSPKRAARPDETPLQRLCRLMCDQMAHHTLGGSWFKLFSKYDVDGSGKLDAHELNDVIRKELKLGKKIAPDALLRELWADLDDDHSGHITVLEFSDFMRDHTDDVGAAFTSSQGAANDGGPRTTRQAERMRLLREQERTISDLNAAKAKPKRDPRSYVLKPSKVKKLCQKLVHQLAKDDSLKGNWFKMFRKYDRDGSGKMDFAEFRLVVREELMLSQRQVKASALRGLWNAIDDDASDLITVKEFGQFMRDHSGTDKRLPGVRRAATPTRRLAAAKQRAAAAAEKSKHGAPEDVPPIDEQTALRLCALLNDRVHGVASQGGGGGSWFKLFNKYDVDGSGRIDFAEFEAVVRTELSLNKRKLPHASLRGLWGAIDDDRSGLITVQEFAIYMRRHQPPPETVLFGEGSGGGPPAVDHGFGDGEGGDLGDVELSDDDDDDEGGDSDSDSDSDAAEEEYASSRHQNRRPTAIEFIELVREDKEYVDKTMHLLPASLKAGLIAPGFMAECEEKFRIADMDGNGVLTTDELFVVVSLSLGLDEDTLTLEACERFASVFDQNHDGVISLGEFCSFCGFVTIMSHLEEQEGTEGTRVQAHAESKAAEVEDGAATAVDLTVDTSPAVGSVERIASASAAVASAAVGEALRSIGSLTPPAKKAPRVVVPPTAALNVAEESGLLSRITASAKARRPSSPQPMKKKPRPLKKAMTVTVTSKEMANARRRSVSWDKAPAVDLTTTQPRTMGSRRASMPAMTEEAKKKEPSQGRRGSLTMALLGYRPATPPPKQQAPRRESYLVLARRNSMQELDENARVDLEDDGEEEYITNFSGGRTGRISSTMARRGTEILSLSAGSLDDGLDDGSASDDSYSDDDETYSASTATKHFIAAGDQAHAAGKGKEVHTKSLDMWVPDDGDGDAAPGVDDAAPVADDDDAAPVADDVDDAAPVADDVDDAAPVADDDAAPVADDVDDAAPVADDAAAPVADDAAAPVADDDAPVADDAAAPVADDDAPVADDDDAPAAVELEKTVTDRVRESAEEAAGAAMASALHTLHDMATNKLLGGV